MPTKPTKTKSKKISQRHTKQEIWNAYNQLLEQIEDEPIGKDIPKAEKTVPSALKSLADLKLSLSQYLDRVGETILQELNSLKEKKILISREKQQMISQLENQKFALDDEIKKTRENWELEKQKYQFEFQEEKAQQEIRRQRAEEEFQYNLKMERRKEQDGYERKRQEKASELAEKKLALEEQQKALETREKELEEMPRKIESAVAESEKKLTKELEEKRAREIYELKLAHQNELNIAELKISASQNILKSQTAEIEALKRQLAESSRQLKDIAVSVVEGRSHSGAGAKDD